MTTFIDDNVPLNLAFNREQSSSEKKITRKAATLVAMTQELRDELLIANVEVAHQKEEKRERAAELVIAKVEKAKRVAELVIANKELLFQNQEKTKRAAELVSLIIKLGLANSKAVKSERQLLSTLNALALARDNETGNHIIRTQRYVKTLALRLRKMGHYENELNDSAIELLFRAAPLHDIGKVGIPDHILHKPGPLSEDEWVVMKTHTTIGTTVLHSSNDESPEMAVMTVAIQIAGGHHERWDGCGYPGSLKGLAIPLAARIMSVADMYDALVSKRVYKKEWGHDEAAQEIILNKGVRFDPFVVDAFIVEQLKFKNIYKKYQDA